MTYRMTQLRRVFKVVNGGTPTSDESNWGGDVPWATPADFDENFTRLARTARTLTTKGAATGSAIVPAGTILLSTRAPIGNVALTRVDMAFNQGCRALVPKVDAQPEYFGYQMVAARDELRSRGMGTTFKELSSDGLAALPVHVPPLEEQRRIADFLDAETSRIDEVTTNRKKQLNLLEHRLDSQREQLLAPAGTASRSTPLMYLTDPRRPIVYGIVQAGPECPGGVPYIKTGDLPELNPRALCRTSPEIHEQYRRAAVRPGDIVMAMRASIGAVALVPPTLPEANLTQGTARISAASNVSVRWLFHMLQTRKVREQCRVRAVGSTFYTLNIWDLRRIVIDSVDFDIQERRALKFEAYLSEHERLKHSVRKQISLMNERRQALIAAAITGQFDVTTASGRNFTQGV